MDKWLKNFVTVASICLMLVGFSSASYFVYARWWPSAMLWLLVALFGLVVFTLDFE